MLPGQAGHGPKSRFIPIDLTEYRDLWIEDHGGLVRTSMEVSMDFIEGLGVSRGSNCVIEGIDR